MGQSPKASIRSAAMKAASHGTAMAGAIAAHGKLSGIALGPHLLAARAFDNTAGGAKGTSLAIYKSLQWAADNGARVINMSFAGPADPNLHRMLIGCVREGHRAGRGRRQCRTKFCHRFIRRPIPTSSR